ncbi:MAG: hypothetical protein Q7K65_00370 [Candidatus Buchananbacteria bacterium]|nr:hypothetical protein [Candidatus Buchananbacteria bacterium]
MLSELKRNGQDFYLGEEIVTDRYYSGTHQIVLGGDCVDEALDVLEDIEGIDIFFYDDDIYFYVVAPELSATEFFERIVRLVEMAIINVSSQDGTYGIRRKIPATPQLPDASISSSEIIDGLACFKATVHLGRGYGTRYSKIDIMLSQTGRKVFYKVQRFNNNIAGPKKDGESKTFSGVGAQWQAICFAYGISPSEGEIKEAAQRAKKFVYAVVGELMDRFWSVDGLQPSFLTEWELTRGRSIEMVVA